MKDCNLCLAATTATNDVVIRNRKFSYSLLGLMPVYNAQAAEGLSRAQITFRRKEITHECMKHILRKLKNGFLGQKTVVVFADGEARESFPFLHFLNLDGMEIASHTMCSSMQCPVCNVRREDLSKTDVPLKLRCSKSVCLSCRFGYET